MPRTLSLYRMGQAWGEGSSGDPAVIEGQGSPAAPGDATWSHAFYPLNTWLEFVPSPSAELSIPAPSIDTQYVWTSAGLIADVQSWVYGALNYGWRLVNTDETSARTFLAFYSDEGAYHLPAVPAGAAPVLVITYTTN